MSRVLIWNTWFYVCRSRSFYYCWWRNNGLELSKSSLIWYQTMFAMMHFVKLFVFTEFLLVIVMNLYFVLNVILCHTYNTCWSAWVFDDIFSQLVLAPDFEKFWLRLYAQLVKLNQVSMHVHPTNFLFFIDDVSTIELNLVIFFRNGAY